MDAPNQCIFANFSLRLQPGEFQRSQFSWRVLSYASASKLSSPLIERSLYSVHPFVCGRDWSGQYTGRLLKHKISLPNCKVKSHENFFLNNMKFSRPIVLKVNTGRGSFVVNLGAKLLNDSTNTKQDTEKCNFVRFEFKINFIGSFYIARQLKYFQTVRYNHCNSFPHKIYPEWSVDIIVYSQSCLLPIRNSAFVEIQTFFNVANYTFSVRWWLDGIRLNVITWSNVDRGLWCHMLSLCYIELNTFYSIPCSIITSLMPVIVPGMTGTIVDF